MIKIYTDDNTNKRSKDSVHPIITLRNFSLRNVDSETKFLTVRNSDSEDPRKGFHLKGRSSRYRQDLELSLCMQREQGISQRVRGVPMPKNDLQKIRLPKLKKFAMRPAPRTHHVQSTHAEARNGGVLQSTHAEARSWGGYPGNKKSIQTLNFQDFLKKSRALKKTREFLN